MNPTPPGFTTCLLREIDLHLLVDPILLVVKLGYHYHHHHHPHHHRRHPLSGSYDGDGGIEKKIPAKRKFATETKDAVETTTAVLFTTAIIGENE